MLLFSETITPRLRYITGFIGEELIGQPLLLTDQQQVFEQYPGAKINYSSGVITGQEIQIHPVSLLFEEGVQPQETNCFINQGQKAFFKTTGDWPFDIFAASFYLLSRYEEYLPYTKDLYGRYPHTESLAFKNGFLDTPLVNYWLSHFAVLLKSKFPSLLLKEKAFRFLPTYDIDEAFSFLHKGWLRNTGGFLRDLFTGHFDQCVQRLKVLAGTKQDPYDAFDNMHRLHEKYQLNPLFFFLLAKQKGIYDKNTDPVSPAMDALIRSHAVKYPVGIHPSWQSGENENWLKEEIDLLQSVSGKPVTVSRQHFLRFTLPGGYRRLLAAGIREDHSMGYGMVNGFRASVAAPFYWYDLEKETTTDLRIYPFCYMDANSFYELKHSPEQALEEMKHYYREVKKVNGLLITLWHNTFLGTDPQFNGWKKVYEDFLTSL
jgi:hypothetical protein